ncbi:YdcF family protein [Mesorhizobium sp. M4B.F.Ca.ET.089.01.1.1]|uniref:YdcF family protein n=1 Tax=Mesorhizobium sp. M4B.F.Ca.ET.089.01.1.1 TaxID=2496662 RepID=UPI000FE432DD|nr:YdcF family protein [Mesorhizobium sp. M4B.F.Ca.ET.089.01.1.1]RWX70830.1 YdcF family protein [Mesorhizobium sp. M4B.F.Ca.ET.089.01.1.1]
MSFIASKLIEIFLLPSNLIAILGVIGLAAAVFGRRKLSRRCLIASALLLAICGWSPLGMAALMALQNRFPKPVIDGPLTGIVLLGGAVDTHVSVDRQTLAMNEAGERLTEAVDLSRRYPDARIFLSGGSNHIISHNQTTESQVARDILVMLGVPAQRIETEERSRTTCENAIESKAAIQPKPGELWLLVTSASHMPRAMACFRAVGFSVAAYPVDYRTRGKAELWRPTGTAAAGLSAADLAAHEWLGLLTYWSSAKTTELFPKP